jgi:hypothetical protein
VPDRRHLEAERYDAQLRAERAREEGDKLLEGLLKDKEGDDD